MTVSLQPVSLLSPLLYHPTWHKSDVATPIAYLRHPIVFVASIELGNSVHACMRVCERAPHVSRLLSKIH